MTVAARCTGEHPAEKVIRSTTPTPTATASNRVRQSDEVSVRSDNVVGHSAQVAGRAMSQNRRLLLLLLLLLLVVVLVLVMVVVVVPSLREGAAGVLQRWRIQHQFRTEDPHSVQNRGVTALRGPLPGAELLVAGLRYRLRQRQRQRRCLSGGFLDNSRTRDVPTRAAAFGQAKDAVDGKRLGVF